MFLGSQHFDSTRRSEPQVEKHVGVRAHVFDVLACVCSVFATLYDLNRQILRQTIVLFSPLPCQTAASQPACAPRPREHPQPCCGCHLLGAAGVWEDAIMLSPIRIRQTNSHCDGLSRLVPASFAFVALSLLWGRGL